MANKSSLVTKAAGLVDQVRTYWKKPMPNRYMPFKEIAAYAGGGIGAYLIICLSYTCMLGATNVFLTGAIGLGLTDMYVLYVIGVLSGIPLTGLRANIIDNTRNKEGKYRPYLLRMGIPSALLFVGMVWFPYDKLSVVFGTGEIFGRSADYVAKCAVVLAFNIALQFFYYFFYDAYENLIHVLSPNSQERADVSSIKSIVYSFGPTVYNIIIPLIANAMGVNQTDIRVYRLAFPIIAVIGCLLVFVVYANTQEKIIQAKTHVIQVKFTDAFRAVAKNKYFWIMSMATWIGFLETAYSNILYWLCNYGGACSSATYSLIVTVYGSAALWGMILAPFCIRRWGKKKVQVVTNLFNILFILCMYPFFAGEASPNGNMQSYIIWAIMACLYLNALVGSFAHILNPSIQADIRDYQQYRTGERIDGMFAAITAIGNVIMLVTAGVLPALQEKFGMTVEVAQRVTSDSSLMSRILPGTKQTIGEMLKMQLQEGQNNFINPSSALYDVNGVLLPLLKILVIVAAAGATLNVIPFFFYDMTEVKQKSYVRVLKIRAMFEDYGNGIVDNGQLVEAIDLIREARENAEKQPVKPDKKAYKSIKDKELRKQAKADYKAQLELNDEIEISKFVCDELDKFSSALYIHELDVSKRIYESGVEYVRSIDSSELKEMKKKAKALPKSTEEEKQIRKYELEVAKNFRTSNRAARKYFKDETEMVAPDFAVLEKYFEDEDKADETIEQLYTELRAAKKKSDKSKVASIKLEIKAQEAARKQARESSKKEMDRHAYFNRAAKVYLDAEKLVKQAENYERFEEIADKYDEAKKNHEEALELLAAEAAKAAEEEKAEAQRIKEERALAKAAKKSDRAAAKANKSNKK